MSTHRHDTLTPPTGIEQPRSSPAPHRRRDLRANSTTPAPLTRRELRAHKAPGGKAPSGKASDGKAPSGKGGFRFLRYARVMSPIGVAAGIVAMVAGVTLLFTNGGLIGGGTAKITNASAPLQTGGWWSSTHGKRHWRDPDRRYHRPYPAPSLATTAPSATAPSASPTTPKNTATTTTASTATAIAVKPPVVQPVTPSGYPDSSNTGVSSGVSLESRSGNVTVSQSGSTVSNLDISGGLIIRGNNITIKNVRVRCSGVSDFCVQLDGTGDVLTDSEVGGGSNGSSFTNAIGIWAGGDSGTATSTQIISTDVHNTSDGMRIDGYTTVRDSYVHELMYTGGVHSDGVQSTSGPNMVFRHNTFVGGTNCTLFLQPSGAQPISNVVVDQNMMIGEARDGSVTSYGLCVDPRVHDVSVTNNRFSRSGWEVAPASQNFSWVTWSNNDWADGSSLAKP